MTSDGQLRVRCEHYLDRVEAHLRAADHPVLEHLRPGLGDAQMDDLTGGGLLLGPELRAWWGWHDGVDMGGDEPVSGAKCLLRNKTAVSLGLALEMRDSTREYMREHAQRDVEPEDQWSRSWLSILAPQPSFVAVCAPTGPTVLVDPLEALAPNGPATVYRCLADFLGNWVEVLDKHVLVPDVHAGWSLNDDTYDTERDLYTQWLSV